MRNRKASARWLVLVFGVGSLMCLILGSSSRVSAIPAFARKYQTSCTTCHNNYPELNDFGEAFKKNGFKFPKDDETFVKEPPVLLGAKAQREVFPKAIYPGEIPGYLPLGFRFSGFAIYNNKKPLNAPPAGFMPRTDLFTSPLFSVFAAGSFGPNISFWIDDDISVDGSGGAGGLGDGYLKVNDIGHYLHLPKNALNVRFGQFELDLPFSQARTIHPTDFDIYTQASMAGGLGTTSNPFVFAAPQRGIEVGGYPNNGNFAWSVSVVNGNNDSSALVRNSKDIYVRVSQRFNLERDADVRKEVQAAGPTGPRDHTSIRFGAFYYYGRNALNTDRMLFPTPIGTIHEPFYRAGGDIRFKYRNLELYGLGMYGHDVNHLVDTESATVTRATPVTFSGGFAGANYWFYPWLIGIMRYDFVNSPTDALNQVALRNTRNRLSPGVQVLVRANTKIVFEYQRSWQVPVPTPPPPFFRPHGFMAGIDYAF